MVPIFQFSSLPEPINSIQDSISKTYKGSLVIEALTSSFPSNLSEIVVNQFFQLHHLKHEKIWRKNIFRKIFSHIIQMYAILLDTLWQRQISEIVKCSSVTIRILIISLVKDLVIFPKPSSPHFSKLKNFNLHIQSNPACYAIHQRIET